MVMFKFSFQEASVTDKESLAAAKQEIDFLRLLEMVVFDNFLSHFFLYELNLSFRQVSRDYDNLRQENAKLREQVLQDFIRDWK